MWPPGMVGAQGAEMAVAEINAKGGVLGENVRLALRAGG